MALKKVRYGFSPEIEGPLDSRFTFPTLDELYECEYFYTGMVAYVESTDKYYKCVVTDDFEEMSELWHEIEFGSNVNSIQNKDIDSLFIPALEGGE